METSGSSNLTGTPFRELTSDGSNGIYYVPENSGTDASRVPLNALVNCTQSFDKITLDEPEVVVDKPDYEIDGVKFQVERKNGFIYLTHPKCSLVGMGKTLLEAETDIRYELGINVTEFNESIGDILPAEMIGWAYRNAIYNYMKDGECQCTTCQHAYS